MDNIKEYCDYLTSFKRTNDVSIDTCHNFAYLWAACFS